MLRYYPLVDDPAFGLFVRRGEKPVAARFLTPERAKKLARKAVANA